MTPEQKDRLHHINGADGIREQFPDIELWYMGGHSLGGAMAASYAAGHADELNGLVLLAAYSTQDLTDSGLAVLSVYGSEDGVLDMGKHKQYRSNLPASTKVDMAIGVTFLEQYEGGPRNSMVLFDRHGERKITYAKVHTCDFDVERNLSLPDEGCHHFYHRFLHVCHRPHINSSMRSSTSLSKSYRLSWASAHCSNSSPAISPPALHRPYRTAGESTDGDILGVDFHGSRDYA